MSTAKAWLNHLQKHGFTEDPGQPFSFVRRTGFLEHSIWRVNLRLAPGKLNIRLGVGYKDKFKRNPISVIWVQADLRRNESPGADSPGEFWDKAELDAALESVLKYGIPWLDSYADPRALAKYFEEHLKQRKAPGDHETLSLLYFELGETEKACEHANAWLNHIAKGSGWAEERSRTRRHLKAMRCPGAAGARAQSHHPKARK